MSMFVPEEASSSTKIDIIKNTKKTNLVLVLNKLKNM